MKTRKQEVDKIIAREAFFGLFIAPFGDAYILMLSLGGLHSQLGLHTAISYWSSFLIIIISICLIPQNTFPSLYLKHLLYRSAP